ncbi:hypothetical protein [Asticcacaulis solisilvae]|uniref:hypothetical protein n=1 Tax=Asticcacaulis solisilvae TaxID=1217274 RepID=UPI003FD84CB9
MGKIVKSFEIALEADLSGFQGSPQHLLQMISGGLPASVGKPSIELASGNVHLAGGAGIRERFIPVVLDDPFIAAFRAGGGNLECYLVAHETSPSADVGSRVET